MHVTKTLSVLALALLGLTEVSADKVFCQRSGNLLERATSSKADKQLAHHKRLWDQSGATTLDEFMERVPHEEIPYLTQGEHGIKLRDVAGGSEMGQRATSDPNAESKWQFTCATPHTVCAILWDGIQYKKGPMPYKISRKKDHSVLYYWYFQPTVEFIAPGGSGNWYPAHGCQNTCVKGLMAANYYQDPSVQVRGDKANPDKVVCMSPTNLENEMVFYMQK